MAYNRLVKTNGQSAETLLGKLAEVGTVKPTDNPEPTRAGSFAFFVGGSWHLLELDPDSIDQNDPIRSLDCDLLQRRVLEPIFGIENPRTDPNIEFVGGIRGTSELERRAGDGERIGISMVPTTIDQLLTVADAGHVMPPKSTWFEPKLRSGLFIHPLD